MSGFIQSGRFGGAAWSPLDLAGLVLWLDADHAPSFTYSSGVVVSQWNDRSASGHHISQGTTAYQPSRNGTIGGLNAVVFDGSNDYLTNSSTNMNDTTISFFVVAKGSGGNDAHFLSGNNDSLGFYIWSSLDKLKLDKQGVSTIGTSTGTYADTTARLYEVTYDGTTARLYTNGAADGTGTASPSLTGSAGVGLGAGRPNGSWPSAPTIGEILYYDTVLGTSDREAVEDYLMTKWGV